jgi:hypothetical protein
MASGWTNRGKFLALQVLFNGTSPPAATGGFKVALVKSTPTADTNTFSQLTEVATGNGYTAGGIALNRNTTDFDVITEDDALDKALVQIKDLVWTASGGTLPSDGVGATYAVLVDDAGTPNVWAYFDLVSARVVSSGQPLTLQNCQLEGDET